MAPAPLAPLSDTHLNGERARFAQGNLKRKVSDRLLDMQIDHGMSHKNVCDVRQLLNDVCVDVSDARDDQWECASADDGGDEGCLEDEDPLLEPFKDAQNWRKHLEENRSKYPYIEPNTTKLEDGDEFASFSLKSLIHRRLNHDHAFRRRQVATSAALRTGERFRKPPDGPMQSMLDGVRSRYHHRLHAPSSDENELRLAGIMQNDDVEV
jgi:hypothetical protein